MYPTILRDLRKPQKLIENRISFAGPNSELSIYDTYSTTSRVGLDADQLLYCGMITGRKIMHTSHDLKEQPFLPHESFVMASGEHVEIDFPDASIDTPTTCLTIEIAKEKVEAISDRMNDLNPLDIGIEAWKYNQAVLHTHHTSATQHLLTRLFSFFTENHPDKDEMVDLGVTELIIRMLRHQEREFLLSYCREVPDATGITAALSHIEKNLSEPLNIEQLSKITCMSRSKLYNEFKKQLGCSPCELLQQLRIKAAAKQLEKGDSVTSVCYDMGFSNPSHFSRRFRYFFGQTPKDYRNNAIGKS